MRWCVGQKLMNRSSGGPFVAFTPKDTGCIIRALGERRQGSHRSRGFPDAAGCTIRCGQACDKVGNGIYLYIYFFRIWWFVIRVENFQYARKRFFTLLVPLTDSVGDRLRTEFSDLCRVCVHRLRIAPDTLNNRVACSTDHRHQG